MVKSKKKKQPKDPVLIARSVIEAAIGEPLTPPKKRPTKRRAKSK
jgi:hypothetical protein